MIIVAIYFVKAALRSIKKMVKQNALFLERKLNKQFNRLLQSKILLENNKYDALIDKKVVNGLEN